MPGKGTLEHTKRDMGTKEESHKDTGQGDLNGPKLVDTPWLVQCARADHSTAFQVLFGS